MRKCFLLALFSLFAGVMTNVEAQITIGDTVKPIDGAILELRANDKGLKLPVVDIHDVTKFQMDGDSLKATGMLVYNSNRDILGGRGKGLYVWSDSVWHPITPIEWVTGVSLDNNQTLSLQVGASQKLKATVSPAGATYKDVTWSTDKTTVATVDNDGTVTAVGAGQAKITVTTYDGNFSAICDVTVTP